MQTHANATHTNAPASSSLVKTHAKNDFDAYSMPVDIPIDEVKAITLKVSPTYHLDQVESVTLKSFRKVVGYDTFNSILKKDRDEKKDPSDHYNVTVSMMIRRIPEEKAPAPLRDPYDGSKTLAETLDKGFPYDDADNSPDDQVANWKNKKINPATLVGKLNGENITKEALVNLVRDSDSPITNGLVQLDSEMNVEKNDFALLDNNVTVSALKNLVTDHPAPITLKLAQTEKNDFALLDNNVTVSALKNLVTDHPAPITLKLAQIEKSDNMNLAQTPITVNPESMMSENTMASAKLGLDKVRVGPDEFNLGQKDATNVQLNAENPVWNPPFNNWSVNQPSPPHDHGDKGDQDLELRDIIIDGVNGYDLVQTRQRNPVWNPPFNNWSVNQPSPPHDHGLPAYQDLGQNIIVDGHAIHYAQKSDPRNFV